MIRTKTGVVGGKDSFNKWNWVCECGTRSDTSFDDREKARDALKAHRKVCSLRKSAPAASTTPAEEAAVATKKKAAAAEAPTEKKPRKPRQAGVKPEQAKAALARIQAGSSTLFAESKALGFTHNGPLRAALRAIMGPDKYMALMAGKRGRRKKEKPAKKATAEKATAAAPTEKKSTPKKAKKAAAKPAAATPPAAAEPAGAVE